ncbi:DUF2855 family protein [Nocardioides albus]|uniref:NADPH:quinone reductase-like Zn-dependent oxidoreductase n=1 Tax=Nocardioides albus TaxID=1841 RepID=A0A7W5F9U3_9ACTN|nr:DUF2855 family protein [Nocardioides albus]MBB3090565.1 NADPH:quinone reductase-like Zn-dependent oxidoreductase [Nocardioides albus]GGU24792.1 hypothetical protein GCM10007979_24490 [Nocardioides albus]
MTRSFRVESLKSDLGVAELVDIPTPQLDEGEVLARIERFALTTNNMTYAVYGDALGYWNLFPATRPGYGCMPAWGYAEIVESMAPGVPVGTRVFGYFPIATHLTMRPTKVTSRSFVDGAEHRTGTPEVYNLYELQPQDADPRLDSLTAIYRALFITSYTAADYLRDRDFFGAEQFVISSASSKTAYGAAYCLADSPAQRIALTSARNVDFVNRLGHYDAAHEYADLTAIDATKRTVYVDLSGDGDLRRRVHEHFGDQLAFDCLVGSTQADGFPEEDSSLVGPAPVFFFAALQLDAYKAEGQSRTFMQRYLRDEREFLERVAASDQPSITLREHAGLDDALGVIAGFHDGSTDPAVGHVFVPDAG